MSRQLLCVTLLLLFTSSCYSVFIGREAAHHVLKKRANHFLEEILPGNLERECYEETCSREEAREIFKSQEKTTEFWYHYRDLNPCKQNPCQNGAICQQYHYSYTCLCPPRYTGRHCENERFECWYKNGGCWQYCTDTARALSVSCSCAQGYTLQEDGKRCGKSARFPCGLMATSTRSLLDPILDSSVNEPEPGQRCLLETTEHSHAGSVVLNSSLSDAADLRSDQRSLNRTRNVRNETAGRHHSNETAGRRHRNETAWGQAGNKTASKGHVNETHYIGNENKTSVRDGRNETALGQGGNKTAERGLMNETSWIDHDNETSAGDGNSGITELSDGDDTVKKDSGNKTACGEDPSETFREVDNDYIFDDHRIVGGMLCKLGHCPWQVLIYTARGQDFCGGSLISSRWVLSAAHCFEDIRPHHVTIVQRVGVTGFLRKIHSVEHRIPPQKKYSGECNVSGPKRTSHHRRKSCTLQLFLNDWEIAAKDFWDYDKYRRDQDEQKIAVLQVFSNPHYQKDHYDHDIAILFLRSPAVFSDYALPICLPSPGLGHMLTQEGEIGQVSGWGTTRDMGPFSRFLLKVRLPIVNQETCMASTHQVLSGNMFCAGYIMEARDSCKGDSGGPFAVSYRDTWYLLGVVSWGEGCAAEGKYGVYTRVANYISWIKETVEDKEGADEPLVTTL